MNKTKRMFESPDVSKTYPYSDRLLGNAARAKAEGYERPESEFARSRTADPVWVGAGLLTTIAALAVLVPPVGLLLGLCMYVAIFRGTIHRWTKD
jgi:hypothetical protein